MTIVFTRLFTGRDAQSHFEDLPIELLPVEYAQISLPIPVNQALFGVTHDVEEIGWHNTTLRQYIIILKGSMEIEVGSGECKIFEAGDVLLAEDTTGSGHVTRSLSREAVQYIILPVMKEG